MNEILLHEIESNLTTTFRKKVKIMHSQTLGGGCINHASKLETDAGTFFLKWNAHCPPDMFAREAEALSDLRTAAKSEILIPGVGTISYKVTEGPIVALIFSMVIL